MRGPAHVLSDMRFHISAGFLLLVFAPFIVTVRPPPIGSFWLEWISAAGGVYLAASILIYAQKFNFERQFSISASPFLVLAILIIIQVHLKELIFPLANVIFAFALFLAATTAQCGSQLDAMRLLPLSLRVISVGLMAAVGVNFISVLLGILGKEIYIFELIDISKPARAVGLLGQPNQLAVLVVLAWVGSVYLFVTNSLKKALFVVFFVLCAITLALASSRVGWTSWISAIFLLAWSLKNLYRSGRSDLTPFPPLRRTLLWLILAVVVGQIIILLGLQVFGGGLGRFESMLLISPRVELLRDGFLLFLAEPLTGIGYNQFIVRRFLDLDLSMLEPNAAHPHNLIFHIFLEFGLTGGLLVLSPILFICYRFWKMRLQHSIEKFIAFVMFATILVYSQFEYPLNYVYFLMPFSLLLGIISASGLRMTLSGDAAKFGWSLAGVGILLLFAVAWDYSRIQKIYIDAYRGAQPRGSVSRFEISSEVIQGRSLTSFPIYYEFMYSRLQADSDPGFNDRRGEAYNLALTRPSGESFGRYVSYLIVEGDSVAAIEFLLKIRSRNQEFFRATMLFLNAAAIDNQRISDFLDKNSTL